MTRHKLIVNPTAGSGAATKLIPAIKNNLKEYDLDFDVVFTEHPWHAAELTQIAISEGYEVVVAVGGDGTANEVINGLMLARQSGIGTATLGTISIGNGNDFSFSMGIPVDLDVSCRALAEGNRREIDIGRISGGLYPQGRYFGNGVGIGFDAVVGFVAKELTHLHGFNSYLVAAIKTIYLYFPAPVMQIEYEGNILTQPSLMVSIMNGVRMGGGFMMAPDGIPNDGLFDLCIAGEVSRARIFPLIARFLKGTQASHSAITTGQSKKVVVKAVNGTLPAHADGETICTEGKELTIEIIPRQIELIYQP